MESFVERQTPAHQCWIHCINADLSLFSLAQCPANEVRTESSGVILSPGYPGNYFNSQTCAWSIKVEPDFNITLFVDTFQSEKQFDALEVFDGKPLRYACLNALSIVNENTILMSQCQDGSGLSNCVFPQPP